MRQLLSSAIALCVALVHPSSAQHPGAVVPLTASGSDIDNVKSNWVLVETSPVAPIHIDPALGVFLFAPNNAGQQQLTDGNAMAAIEADWRSGQ